MSDMKRSSGGWSEPFLGESSTGRTITTVGTTTNGWRVEPTFGTASCHCLRACCPPTSTSTASRGSVGCGTHMRHVSLGHAPVSQLHPTAHPLLHATTHPFSPVKDRR